jgi:hypothetical protein
MREETKETVYWQKAVHRREKGKAVNRWFLLIGPAGAQKRQ